MARYKITAPVPNLTKAIAGVPFVGSVGETDSHRAALYFRRHGYQVEDSAAAAEPVDEAGDGGQQAPAPALPKPAKSATKADWVAYAVAQGVPAEEAEASTRDALVERFAEPAGGTQ